MLVKAAIIWWEYSKQNIVKYYYNLKYIFPI